MLELHNALPLTSAAPFDGVSKLQIAKLGLAFIAIAIILPFLLYIYYDYLAFISLGPGGTPPTLAGFLRVELLGFFALRNPYTAAEAPERLKGQPGYLESLEERLPPRPHTRGIAPHRQITQKASKDDFERLASAIKRMGASNPNLLIGTSCFEKHGTGLFSISPAKRTCKGEICHAHPSDGSLHLTLHPADARTVLEAGWGERHPIARGGWFERFVPGGFIMCYAPRDEREVETVLRIVRAAAWFVSGGDGVVDVREGRRDSGYCSATDVSEEVSGYASIL
ncbi:hypothetical protein KC360_g3719 [Hortaea werneckii]|nr:hypothetical protein KC325_g1664 [Hortaea werneckii]KAI7001541.1 hypothetical protein KC359_g623 [Hortaea werneckii]KAI7149491.1 hypothetical protein KC344_g1018 [Hortaea werneckii]KAI7175316.1 hypothetical protein KC360_g3719 [Hortaea werneckii]KAI7511379.1 hypothetical protein KC347_g3442 [Hortaea werneckii]